MVAKNLSECTDLEISSTGIRGEIVVEGAATFPDIECAQLFARSMKLWLERMMRLPVADQQVVGLPYVSVVFRYYNNEAALQDSFDF